MSYKRPIQKPCPNAFDRICSRKKLNMELAFILDPLSQLKAYKDSSVAMMREAARRGHQVLVGQPKDIHLRHGQIRLSLHSIHLLEDDHDWFTLGAQLTRLPEDIDAILMRKDPPFDNEYLYSTHLLSMAQRQGATVINHPDSIRDWNEKLSIARFPQLTPEFEVTSQPERIRHFLHEFHDIVVKPLDGMGGSGVFRLTQQDPNIGVIIETITRFGQQTVMAQRYLPDIVKGDKRILMINGEPVPFALARIPMAGETRGNLAAGGRGVAQALSGRDIEIARTVGPELVKHGLFLVGLDVIGDFLTEINVTSPTCMVEIAQQTGFNPAAQFMDALEAELGTEELA